MIVIPPKNDMSNVIEEEEKILFSLHLEASRQGQHLIALRAYQIVDFSSQFGSEHSLSYTAENFIGAPAVYPRVGDHAYSFQLRTYGKWWLKLPSYPKVRSNLPLGYVESQDFIEFRVERRVMPVLLRVYEVYNPGAIVKILSFCYDIGRWINLWQGEPELVNPKQSRCFSVPFKEINFLSDYYRIEFHHKHLNYFCEFDGLILFGADKFPQHIPIFNFPKPSSPLKQIIEVNNSNKLDNDGSSYFDFLPQEVILSIMSYLDLKSLCNASTVSRLFKRACYDPILYRDLNLKIYWHIANASILKGLVPRLESMRSLDLSWCGGQGRINSQYFIEFLEAGFEYLTILRVSCCPFINDSSMKAIEKSCPNLEVLEMRSCRAKELTHVGFEHISKIEKLKYLDLYRSFIDTVSTVMIVRSCKNLVHLFLGSCTNITNLDEVVRVMSENLRNIKSLDFWRGISLTCIGILYLAESCHNLIEVDLGWCYRIDANCGCLRQFITRNPRLQKLFLSAIRTVSNAEVDTVANHCKEMEQFDILGTSDINLEACQRLLESCTKLKLFDVSYCDSSVKQAIPHLQERFPTVDIKCSIPSDLNNY